MPYKPDDVYRELEVSGINISIKSTRQDQDMILIQLEDWAMSNPWLPIFGRISGSVP
jgi:hypothetical protein